MTEAALQVLREALGLSPIERAELIDGLLRSFDPNPDQRHLDAWKEEAESRIDAFDAGMLTDDSAEAVFDRINQR